MIRRAAAAAVLVLALAACGSEESGIPRGPDGELTVQGAFVPEPPLSLGALYLVLDNRTGTDDALVAATTDAAAETAVHGAGMADVDGLPLPDGQQTALEPGGAHVMLSGLDGVEAGDTLVVTLEFAVHPPITLEVPVAPIGSLEAP
jgi:periplasmic copper chaperone A